MKDQKIAVVTGANRGLGLAITRQLAQMGIHVVATARDAALGQAMLQQLQAENLPVSTFTLEVTDAQACEALLAHVEQQFGRLDILVNNAGIAADQWVSGFDLDIDMLREIMEVNLYSALRLTQLFMPMMKAQGHGRIVNMSSELATLSQCQMGSTIGYRMSKAAMNSMTVLLAQELKEFPDILINAAAPGWVNTELGGPDAPRTPEEGADTPVWLATLPEGGPSGEFYRDREVYPW
jgi:NAD(P)-dependent dehydrogenase (short-subunit alcohol dehydrogenase family)